MNEANQRQPIHAAPQLKPGEAQPAPREFIAAVTVCLLQDRAKRSEAAEIIETLAGERHAHFHTKASSRSERATEIQKWRECDHEVCVQLRDVLDRMMKPEFLVTPIQARAAGSCILMFEETPGGIRAYLKEKSPIITGPAVYGMQ